MAPLSEVRFLTFFCCILCCMLVYVIFMNQRLIDRQACSCVCNAPLPESIIVEPKHIIHEPLSPSLRIQDIPKLKQPIVTIGQPVVTVDDTPGRQIFIDVGANDGSSVNYFLKKEGADFKVPWVQGGSKDGKLAGRGAEGLWDLYVIEANPFFTPKLRKIGDEYIAKRKVASYNLYNSTAITTENGLVTFKLDVHNKGNGNFGSTLMKDSRSVVGIGKDITVMGIDIVYFLKEIVKVRQNDYLILKIDIEGKEYDVMRRLITSNMISYVDDVAVEYHHSNFGVFGGKVSNINHYIVDI